MFLLSFKTYNFFNHIKALKFYHKMNHHVFVYGTLKRGEPNHYWLTNPENGISKFIGEAKTANKYPLIIASKYNIPFLLYKPGDGHHVRGEVYEVDDLMLNKLDILEDHPAFYIREIDSIKLLENSDHKTINCWIYFIKNFRPNLLGKPCFENYSSAGDHGLPYLERSKRDPNYNHKPEILSCNESTIDDLNDDIIKK